MPDSVIPAPSVIPAEAGTRERRDRGTTTAAPLARQICGTQRTFGMLPAFSHNPNPEAPG